MTTLRRSARRLLLLAVPLLFLVPLAVPFAAELASGTAAPPAVALPHGAASAPNALSCSTPASAGRWGGPGGFFGSVSVQFYVPGSPSLSGSNFNTTPCSNTIPTYVNGFWMNISTDVPILIANVTIWGLSWALPNTVYAQPISGYSPGVPYDSSNHPSSHDMYVNGPTDETASFFFNDYRDFLPGDTVYFNLSVTANATPAIIYSGSDAQHSADEPAGASDVATWSFDVATPWTSNNFTQDVAVSATPNVLGSSPFDPNINQTVQITLNALDLGDGTTVTIPEAEMTMLVYLGGAEIDQYNLEMGPANHSVESIINPTTQLPQPVGPFPPGAEVTFNFTAWVPWEGGAIDRLYSPSYTYYYSNHGGWPNPHGPVESNLVLTTDPAGLNASPLPLPTMTAVNVTIHEPIENVTIQSAQLRYAYHDRYGSSVGTIPMLRVNANTTYAVIPGLPPGGNITFSVAAKDIFNDTISSGNYSYFEQGTPAFAAPAGYGYLFFEAVDLSTGRLANSIPFQLSNSSWSETATGTAFGFGGIFPPAGTGYLLLHYDNYTLTVSAFGAVQTAVVHLFQGVVGPIVFYFTSAPLPTLVSVTATTFPIAATIGLAAAAVVVVPVRDWFKERRKKAEAEQKRISL